MDVTIHPLSQNTTSSLCPKIVTHVSVRPHMTPHSYVFGSDITCTVCSRLLGLPRPLFRSVGIIRTVRLFFGGSLDLFISSKIAAWPFHVLWHHSYDITNHFSIGHPFFLYSNSNTFNRGVLKWCVAEKDVYFDGIANQINSFKLFYVYHKLRY